MEEVEDQDGQDRDGSGDHIAHGVSGGGHHDLGINLFSKGTVKTAHPEFDSRWKESESPQKRLESQLFGWQNFFKGTLKKPKPTSRTRKATIRAAMYSIRPWPKG